MTTDPGMTRPYDWRWGNPNAVEEIFGISKADLKRLYLDGWIKGRQVTWRDDEHRAQTIFCFEDIHRWLEEVAHAPTREYTKRFWAAAEIAKQERERASRG